MAAEPQVFMVKGTRNTIKCRVSQVPSFRAKGFALRSDCRAKYEKALSDPPPADPEPEDLPVPETLDLD